MKNKKSQAKRSIIILAGLIALGLLVFISAVAPSVKLVSPTPTNGSFQNVNNIFINVSANETGSELRNITFYLFNSTDSLNTSLTYNLSLSVNLINNSYGTFEGISATSEFGANYASKQATNNVIEGTYPWLGSGITNQNVTINFTSPQIFDTIEIFAGYSGGLTSSVNNTNIYVSDDYSSWTKIGNTISLFGAVPINGQFHTINFTEQNKRYLRLEFKDGWGNEYYIGTTEIRVYKNNTVNLANLTSTTVTATQTAFGNINFTRDNLYGQLNNEWGTDAGPAFNVNITWNFQSIKRTGSLEWTGRADAGPYMPANYSIWVSNDGSAYTKISNGTFTNGNAMIERINWTQQNTQYLKIELKEGYHATYLFASEIKILEELNTSYTHNFTNLADGTYKYNVTAYDIYKYAGSSETRNVTIDTITPLIDFVSPTPANASGILGSFSVNVSITELNLANVTYTWNGTNTTYDLITNASYFAGSAPNWIFNLTQGGLVVPNSYTYRVWVMDKAGTLNSTSLRTVNMNSPPTFISIDRSPLSSENLDPNVLINVTVNISDTDSNFDTAILQWKNTSAAWGDAANVTMLNSTAKGAYTILNASFTPTYEANYSYRIWANDTSGSSNISSISNISVFYDCTWLSTPDMGSTAGWDANKFIGNLSINNTGDSAYSVSNCSLDFRLTYDLTEGRIYFDNSYLKPSNTYTISAKANRTIEVNASFLSEIKEEAVIITTQEMFSRSNTSKLNTTVTILSSQSGPYLFQKVTSNPNEIFLTAGNFSLEGYLRNLMGGTTVNATNTAYNVTFNWTLPSGFKNVSGNYKTNFTNITDSDLHYNNINVSFSSLASMTSGVKTFYLYAAGVNVSGGAIKDSNNNTIMKKEANITFSCYSTSDSVCVTACGSANDPDCITSSSASSGGGGGGSGRAGPSTIVGKSSAEYELVRGREQSFELEIQNKYSGVLENLKISVSGIDKGLIEVFPTKISRIEPGASEFLTVKIIAPAYFTEGSYALDFLISGELVSEEKTTPYTERKRVDLFIVDLSREEVNKMKSDSLKMIEQMNNTNMSLKEVLFFYSSLEKSYEERKFSLVKQDYESIKKVYENAFGSLKLIEELYAGIKDAEKRGISVLETKKLLFVGEVAFKRGDYSSSIERLKEAKLTYALETKGEFNLFYAVKNNPLESTGILLGAIFVSFSSFLSIKYRLYKRKLRMLTEEEKLLLELMKVVQRETFEKNHLSMEEYGQAMSQYETKLFGVIEDKIKTETKLAHFFKLKGKQRALKQEKEKLYNLVKNLQDDYLNKGKIETRVYENMIKVYSARIIEIDERLIFIEAKEALSGKLKIKK